MYMITQSLTPFGWEKTGLAEHKEIKAGCIKMHQIHAPYRLVQTSTLQTLKDSVTGKEYTT